MDRYQPVTFRDKLHEVIFEADTKAGKRFDIFILIAIIVSVIVVMLESVDDVKEAYGTELYAVEWFFTILFSLEYIARIYALQKPLKYVKSFFGVIDLLSVLPTYFILFLPVSGSLISLRILRLMRIFRVLKLIHFLKEARTLKTALMASRSKILVFLLAIFALVTILGSFMYIIETKEAGFTSIPRSIYWAIVTLTTVGYGDIAPMTNLGQLLASIIMILGYAIIAVPTGIVTSELAAGVKMNSNTQACRSCGKEGHADDADFCKFCGTRL